MSDGSVAKLRSAGINDAQRLEIYKDCERKATGGGLGVFRTIAGFILDAYTADIPGLTVDFVNAWKEDEAGQGCQSFLTTAEIDRLYPPPGTPGHAHYSR